MAMLEATVHSSAFNWIAVAVACILLEVVSWSLTSIWFSGGAIVVAILSTFVDISPEGQISIFLAVSFTLLLLTKHAVKKHVMPGLVYTNTDALIGQTAYVISDISPRCDGRVKVSGKTWKASSAKPIGAGEEVVVLSIEGVTLKVERKVERKEDN